MSAGVLISGSGGTSVRGLEGYIERCKYIVKLVTVQSRFTSSFPAADSSFSVRQGQDLRVPVALVFGHKEPNTNLFGRLPALWRQNMANGKYNCSFFPSAFFFLPFLSVYLMHSGGSRTEDPTSMSNESQPATSYSFAHVRLLLTCFFCRRLLVQTRQ